MMLSQKIVGITLLLLFIAGVSIPLFNQIALRDKTKQAFIEVCNSATSATNNNSACDCAWGKALDKYGYEKVEIKMRYNGSVDPVDLFTWILDCKA